jgi:hypothetical protein
LWGIGANAPSPEDKTQLLVNVRRHKIGS